jgi:broad specificity phosphatase PhoE
MGFAVDDTVELPSGYVPGEFDNHEQWGWPHPYRIYAELLGRGGGLAIVAEAHRRIWTSVVEAVPDGAAALVVAHGGGIEPGLVACLPDVDHELWGAPLGHCDGGRLGFDEGRFVSVKFSRVPAELLPPTSASFGTRRAPVIPLVIPPRITGRHESVPARRPTRLDQRGPHPAIRPGRSWVDF